VISAVALLRLQLPPLAATTTNRYSARFDRCHRLPRAAVFSQLPATALLLGTLLLLGCRARRWLPSPSLLPSQSLVANPGLMLCCNAAVLLELVADRCCWAGAWCWCRGLWLLLDFDPARWPPRSWHPTLWAFLVWVTYCKKHN